MKKDTTQTKPAENTSYSQRNLVAIFFIAVVLVALASVVSTFYEKKMINSARWVEHTLLVLYETEKVNSLSNDLESESRAYILTGNAADSSYFFNTTDSIGACLAAMKRLTSDNPLQQKNIDTLVKLNTERTGFFANAIRLKDENDLEAAIDYMETPVFETLTARIRAKIAGIKSGEERLLSKRRIDNALRATNFNHTLYFVLAVASAGLVITFLLSKKSLSARAKAEKKLAQNEARVRRIFDSNMMGVIFWDKEGAILETNDRFLDIVGYSRADLEAGKLKWNSMTPAEYSHLDKKGIEQVENTGICMPFEKEYYRKDGSRVHIMIGAASLTADPFEGVAYVTDITDKKLIEDKLMALNRQLSASEKRFRALIENSYDIVSISDSSFNLVYRSPSAERITGWSNNDPQIIDGISMVHPDDVPAMKQVLHNVIQNPAVPYHVEFRTRHKDGHYIFLEGVITNMLDVDAIKGVVSNFKNVTKTKEAEYKLKESEHIYRTIASNIPGSVLTIIDTEYRYLLVEGDMLDKLGYSKETVLGNTARELLTPERFSELLPDFKRVFSGEKFTTETKMGDYYVLSKYVPLKDDDNSISSAMIVVLDITELKKAQQHILELNTDLEQKILQRTSQLQQTNKELENNMRQVKESEEKFSKIFDASPVGISIGMVDTGIIIDANKSFSKLTGFDINEIIGHTSAELEMIDAGERERIMTELKAHGKVMARESVIYNRKKERLSVLLSIDRFLIAGTWYAITIAYDITERKKSEQQLATANKELEAFSYTISHDLRAPLRAIHGYSSILAEDYQTILDTEGSRLITQVQRNAKRMGALIDDLLSFSQLGRKEVKKTEIDMKKLVEGAIEIVKAADKHAVNIIYNGLHPVYGDFSLIGQVMVNLISNAVKYSSKNPSPLVEISSVKEKNEVIYSVKDNGVGFDMQYAHKLFGVFERLHSNEEFSGTGVGLAITERIIAKHKGRIWAVGELGEGATFYFALPNS